VRYQFIEDRPTIGIGSLLLLASRRTSPCRFWLFKLPGLHSRAGARRGGKAVIVGANPTCMAPNTQILCFEYGIVGSMVVGLRDGVTRQITVRQSMGA